MVILLVLAAVVVVVYFGLPAQALVWLLLAAGLWWVSLQLWPHKTCRQCGGSGVRSGPFSVVRRCASCSGTGMIPRIGSGE